MLYLLSHRLSHHAQQVVTHAPCVDNAPLGVSSTCHPFFLRRGHLPFALVRFTRFARIPNLRRKLSNLRRRLLRKRKLRAMWYVTRLPQTTVRWAASCSATSTRVWICNVLIMCLRPCVKILKKTGPEKPLKVH